MVREVLTISVGQGGLQLGNSIWKQYFAEHEIDHTGRKNKQSAITKKEEVLDKSFETFFEEIESSGQYVPRYLGVDLEPTVIDEIKKGNMYKAFNQEYLVNGIEDAANLFARGYYTVGKELMDKIENRLRHMIENCESPQGFLVNHSVGGGTGSGLGCQILEFLSANFKKLPKFGFEIYPSPNISTSIVEPYNTMFSSKYFCDHTDVSLIMDNEALYGLCQKKLNIKTPDYKHLNNIIAKLASSTTASLRFEGEQNVDMSDFQTNLVPFPRLHFMISSLSPIVSKYKIDTHIMNGKILTTECFNSNNFFVYDNYFDTEEDKYLAISLNYRGNIRSKVANEAIDWVKKNNKVRLVDFVPTGFKLGFNDRACTVVENDIMAYTDINATMIGNNVSIRRVFERSLKKTSMMYSQRAYVHWYVGEGMEEGEFDEAKEDLEYLNADYLDAVSPDGASDTEEDIDYY